MNMAFNKDSVEDMKEYLRYALEFEKYVYIWTRAMNNANNLMKQAQDEKLELNECNEYLREYETALDQRNSYRYQMMKQAKRKYSRKASIALAIIIAIIVGSFVFGVYMGDPFTGIFYGLIMTTFTGIIPACVIIFFINMNKAKKSKQEGNYYNDSQVRDKQLEKARTEEDDINNAIRKNELTIIEISNKQEEIRLALAEAKKQRKIIYSNNIIHPDYQNLNAVATMYEYLIKGRCNTICGHGGIFDTYDTEKIQIAQLAQMIQMNQTLNRIEDYQRYICQQLNEIKGTLSSINSHLASISSTLDDIKRINTEIAHNTAISATANQQTAEAVNYMIWVNS
jgi:DNA repair exonuclease SbcCD ATPase subunit